MSERPWLKWYPSDWRGDPLLRVCSLSARGLWLELLGFMHEAKPTGYLLINGRIPTAATLAALVGSDLKSITKALQELETNGVFSRRENDGCIFSRRMVRDADKSAKGREWAGKRWGQGGSTAEDGGDGLPNGSTQGYPGGKPIGSHNESPNGSPNEPPSGSPSTPEARGHNPEGNQRRSDFVAPREAAFIRQLALSDPPQWWAALTEEFSLDGAGKRVPTVNGYDLRVVAGAVLEAARINDAAWRGDWRTLVAWLRDGIDSNAIVAAVSAVARRPGYAPPGSLKYFDGAVRDAQRAA